MAETIIVGDGPGGLSAALFLAKNDHTVTVYGQDQTAMHHAQLRNYLGLPDISGSDFQSAARDHARAHGATVVDEAVTAIEVGDVDVTVQLASSPPLSADYLILAGGKSAQRLARDLGLTVNEGRLAVDGEYRTAFDRVYAIGRLTRPDRSQAIVSAGAGAIAALDILSREGGRDVHDWDTPPEHDHEHPDL